MNQPLFVSTDGVTSLSDLHGEVAAAVSGLAGQVPDTPSTESSYGTIASGFTSALRQALPSRESSLRATSTAGETIGDLLRAAAAKYDEGDQQGAERLRAAAEALAHPGSAAGPVAGAGTAGAGGDQAGQMAGQVGQQVGQLAQGLAQSVQGLAQGLTQLPQQIVQGVQGIVDSAAKADAEESEKDEKEEKDEKDRKDGAATSDDERDDGHRRAPAPSEAAQSGRSAEGSAAPPPVAKPAPPAQTRPQ